MSNKRKYSNHWEICVNLLKEIAIEKYGKGWQTYISENSHLSQSNVSRIFSLKYAPSLPNFLVLCKAIKVNIFFEDQEDKTELNVMFERAMDHLGRRPDNLPKN